MEDNIRMTSTERQALLTQYRQSRDPRMRLRAHIILLLAQGYSWALISAVLFCSTRTIARNRVIGSNRAIESDEY